MMLHGARVQRYFFYNFDSNCRPKSGALYRVLLGPCDNPTLVFSMLVI